MSLFEKIWLGAPFAMWFSYRPLLRFGQDASMYFELSIALIYIVILALAGIPVVMHANRSLLQKASVRLVGALVVVSGVSLLWTPNLTRGVLTFGLIGALGIVFLASIARAKQLEILAPLLVKLLLLSAVSMSVLAIVQLVAAIWLNQDLSLLCRGCTPNQFGFARPNVFAIEPQFFGNMLLTPALLLFYRLLRYKPKLVEVLSFLIILTALCLTISRGAIYAFGAGVVILMIFHAKTFDVFFRSISLLAAAFAASLLLQGSVAAANPQLNATFAGAISASINQLSLGIIDVKIADQTAPDAGKAPQETSYPIPADETTGQVPHLPDEVAPNFTGYVEESTNVRLTLSRLALQAWAGNIGRIIFGVGLGGSGVVLQNEFPNQVNEREIVQNEYAEILLENGLIGFGLFGAVIGLLLYSLRRHKWLWAVVAAFLVQWNFFSGYPNALHIYLTFIFLAIYASEQRAHAQKKPRGISIRE